MSQSACPICGHRNLAAAMRCGRCGANLSDPDVLALAEGGELAGESLSAMGESGALASDRFFGVSLSGLVDGDLARLGLGGAALLAAGFLVPVSRDLTSSHMPWSAAAGGDAAALFLPLAAALVGVVAALARGLGPTLRLALLAVAGLVGLGWELPALGELASTASPPLSLVYLAMGLGGAALILRALRPARGEVRAVLAGAAALLAVVSLVPLWDAARLLPFELRLYLPDGGGDGTRSYLATFAHITNRDPLVFFTSLLALAPVALLAGAAALGWGRSAGPWDKRGALLRPVAYFFAIYFALFAALQVFNLVGWSGLAWVRVGGRIAPFDAWASTRELARFKLALLGLPFMLWAQLGVAALWLRLRGETPGQEA